MGTYRLLSEKQGIAFRLFLVLRVLSHHSITSREKDPEKLREKLTRGAEVPDALLKDITDLAV